MNWTDFPRWMPAVATVVAALIGAATTFIIFAMQRKRSPDDQARLPNVAGIWIVSGGDFREEGLSDSELFKYESTLEIKVNGTKITLQGKTVGTSFAGGKAEEGFVRAHGELHADGSATVFYHLEGDLDSPSKNYGVLLFIFDFDGVTAKARYHAMSPFSGRVTPFTSGEISLMRKR